MSWPAGLANVSNPRGPGHRTGGTCLRWTAGLANVFQCFTPHVQSQQRTNGPPRQFGESNFDTWFAATDHDIMDRFCRNSEV